MIIRDGVFIEDYLYVSASGGIVLKAIKSDFVSLKQNEFYGLTTIQHLRHCRYRSGKNEINFSWRRNIRPTSDRMILEIEIKTSRSGGWLPSQLTLLVDCRRIDGSS